MLLMRNPGSNVGEQRQSLEFARGDPMIGGHHHGIVAMLYKDAGNGRPGDFGVLKVLRELVSVAPTAHDDGQGEEGQNIRPEELAHCIVHFRTAIHELPALNLRLTGCRDGR